MIGRKTIAQAHGHSFPSTLEAGARGRKGIAAEAKKRASLRTLDRGGYNYGGQVKVLADAAREQA